MSLIWIQSKDPLPAPHQADAQGLVAAGLDLSPARLFEAYREGIFPWYNPGDPVLWWSPDPRMVLFTAEFHLSQSMRKKLRQVQRQETATEPTLQVSCNLAFHDVMQACAASRAHTTGTWISQDIIQVYHAMHQAGFAHSIETWMDGELVGGLYGMNLGNMFFGESMFSLRTDASKISLAYLVDLLSRSGMPLIDCQQETGHLASLGARAISRQTFMNHLYDLRHARQRLWPHSYLRYGQTLLGE